MHRRSLVERIAARLSSSPPFAGGVWLNTEQEAQAFANGTAEGMSVWNGRWVNLAGRGTIVFGEEHNEIRELFARALNIRHRLVEGAWERSLHGVPDIDIAQHVDNPRAHSKYRGRRPGAGELLAARGSVHGALRSTAIEALRVFADEVWTARRRNEKPTAWIPPLERLGELIELVQTLQRTTVPPPTAADRLQREIVLALDIARYYAIRCEDFRLLDLARLDAATDRRAHYRNRKWIEKLSQQDPARSRWLHTCYAELASAVQRLGHLQFLASASKEEIEQDRLRIARATGARAQDPEAVHFTCGPRDARSRCSPTFVPRCSNVLRRCSSRSAPTTPKTGGASSRSCSPAGIASSLVTSLSWPRSATSAKNRRSRSRASPKVRAHRAAGDKSPIPRRCSRRTLR